MGFYTLLQSGAAVKSTAERFVRHLLLRKRELQTFDLSIAASFINDIMHAIGLPCNITAQEMQTNVQSRESREDATYNWPAERHTYTFHYDAAILGRLEQFLVLISQIVMELTNEYLMQEEPLDETDDDDVMPLEVFLELLSFWCSAIRHLQATERHTPSHFDEPLARINYRLLMGVHLLRLAYSELFPLLHNICDRLYQNALRGISYREAHQCIVPGLLYMFEHDLFVFHTHDPRSIDFFYAVFGVADQRKSYILTYKVLTSMLGACSRSGNDTAATPPPDSSDMSSQLLTLTSFLVSDKMLQVYYTHLRFETTKGLLHVVLVFLKALQSTLVSLDIFSQNFVEAILKLVLTADCGISDQAAELYTLMMSRILSSDNLILKHHIEFFVRNQETPKSIDAYVNALWPHSPFMRSTHPYLIMLKTGKSDLIRYCAVHMLVSVYKRLQTEIETYTYRRIVAKTLKIMPQFLAELNCAHSRNILLSLYVVSDYDKLRQYIRRSELEQYIKDFEQYAVKQFMENKQLYFNDLLNLFNTFHHCLTYTYNWDLLEILLNDIYQKFRQCEVTLTQHDPSEPSSIQILHEYNHKLLQLNVALRLDYNVLDYIDELYEALKNRLLINADIMIYVKRTNLLMDVHAIEILTTCIKKLSFVQLNDTDEGYHCCMEARRFIQVLFSYLLQMDEKKLATQPLVRVCSIFNSIISIYCIFNMHSSTPSLEVERNSYNILINVLIAVTFNAPTQNETGYDGKPMHKTCIHDLQKCMLKHFIYLHELPQLKVQLNVWKICIFYGQRNYNQFNDELVNLLSTLASKHFELYRQCLIALVYNLHTQQPPVRDYNIRSAITAHIRLFDARTMKIDDAEVLRVSTLLGVLQNVEKSLKAIAPNPKHNRLSVLKHLNIFTKSLNVNAQKMLVNIRPQAKQLERYKLTAKEATELKMFLAHYPN